MNCPPKDSKQLKALRELSAEDLIEELVKQAKEISGQAFAPCSGFRVGAALVVEDSGGNWQIVSGVNYETCNYKSTCAEQNALAEAQKVYAQAGKLKLIKLAVYSPDSHEPLTPCGNCRQILSERNPKLEVIACDASMKKIRQFQLGELLPYAFGIEYISKKD
ncbi:MAG: cytidine deaminase [Candidatus Caenarcaniphilales bacterium]|nr:cytidine deaminase [Candidatus Caenarcaniphilales bacterium]